MVHNSLGQPEEQTRRLSCCSEEEMLLKQVSIGSVYSHYSGKQYKVTGVFRHSEDLVLYVAYEGLYEPGEYGRYWIRPLAMFLETVIYNGIEQPRFKKQ